jgi:hypothetical protein
MKRIKRIILVLVLLVIVLVGAGIFWINHIAKVGIEAGSTYALGVDTTLDGVDIGILAGRSELSGLTVANPEGFASPHFLSLGNGVVSVSLGSLTRDTVEVPEFSLTGIDMNLERIKGKSNYGVITNNLGRFESGDAEDKEETASGEEDDGKKFVIREILIRDVKVHVNYVPTAGEAVRSTVPVKELRLENVGTGSEGGVQVAELTSTLIKAIMAAALEQGGGVIPKEISGELASAMESLQPLAEVGAQLMGEAGGALQQIGGQLDGLTGQAESAEKDKSAEGSEAKEDSGTKLLKGVGGLLKPQKKGDGGKTEPPK